MTNEKTNTITKEHHQVPRYYRHPPPAEEVSRWKGTPESLFFHNLNQMKLKRGGSLPHHPQDNQPPATPPVGTPLIRLRQTGQRKKGGGGDRRHISQSDPPCGCPRPSEQQRGPWLLKLFGCSYPTRARAFFEGDWSDEVFVPSTDHASPFSIDHLCHKKRALHDFGLL